MRDQLLTTKLHAPQARAGLVHRPRLVERIDEGLTRRLTLISAAPGSGKTTLLSEWYALRRADTLIAWLSLDDDDNDPPRFWRYLIAALQSVAPGVGEQALSLLQLPQQPSVKTLVITLINALGALTHDLILVLDDYHVIDAQPIHDALAYLLDHMPQQLRVIIASRVDPPLPLARLRARDQVTELRAADMRFTLEEAAAFLNKTMGLNLTPQDVAELEKHTEGWVVGLQLAALSMRSSQAADSGIRGNLLSITKNASGSQRFILDYLAEEVFRRQTSGVQDFLLRTSILDQLSAPLCNVVTQQHDSQAVLEALDSANLFIVALDGERRWYRYHHLFGEYLRDRLERTQPEQTHVLHERASTWYEQQAVAGDGEFMAKAVEHALAARDFERAGRLVERTAIRFLARAETVAVLGWLKALPEELVRTRPRLCLYAAWVLLANLDLSAAQKRVYDAERLLLAAGAPDTSDRALSGMWGEAAAIGTLLAAILADIPRAIELSRRATERLGDMDVLLRGFVVYSLSIVHMLMGDVIAAHHTFDEAVRASLESGNIMVAVLALCNLGDVQVLEGQLHAAVATYQRVERVARDRHGQPLPIAVMSASGLAEVYREWNKLEQAQECLAEGIRLAAGWGEFSATDAYIVLARVKQAQGYLDEAGEALRHAAQVAVRSDITQVDDVLVALHQARLWLMQGEWPRARLWAESRGLLPSAAVDQGASAATSPTQAGAVPGVTPIPVTYQLMREMEQTVLARLFIAQGHFVQAIETLDALLPAAEAGRRVRNVIEMLVLKAVALHCCGDTPRAAPILLQALSLAEPEGFIRLFIDEGRPMAELLERLEIRDWRLQQYRGKLVAQLIGSGIAKASPSPISPDTPGHNLQSLISHLQSPPPLIEPLSERELEVLRLIAAGASNREIADRLIVAVNTIKKHTGNIFGKLGVTNRTQAVARARELGLI
ncbi:MAG: LuxR C-terminal-related transcriptional regulator [Chloroflexi bacterium]|nr:LuxR C-terminal-related transcriptional regulator [Chloroflexota bacterium]